MAAEGAPAAVGMGASSESQGVSATTGPPGTCSALAPHPHLWAASRLQLCGVSGGALQPACVTVLAGLCLGAQPVF